MPGIPAALDAVVLQAMAKPPSRRFQSMKDLALALSAAVGDDARRVWGVDEAPAKETPTVQSQPVQSALASWATSRRMGVRALPLWGGIAAAFVIAVAMLWVSRARAPSASAVAPSTPIAVAPSPAAKVEIAAPPVVAPSAAAATSHVSIVSVPPGADVMRDGAPLGRTPLELDLPSTSAPFDVTLSRRGFKDAAFRVQPDLNRDYRLTLTPTAHHAKPSEPVSHPPPAASDKKPPELKDVFSD
jgi:serine/threonine-protein kinase